MRKIVAVASIVGVFAAAGGLAPLRALAQDQIAYNAIEPAVALRGAIFDLDRLEARLRDTPAIGFWSKLQLEGKLAEILDGISRHHGGGGEQSIEAIKARFWSLADETAAKLKGGDPALSYTIASSREAIWQALLRR